MEVATPVGNHDRWDGVVGPSRCRAEGWAIDPDDRYVDLNVGILADGIQFANGVANLIPSDLIDAGVSPDGFSRFYINLCGLLTLNEPHVIRAPLDSCQSRSPARGSRCWAPPGDLDPDRHRSYFRRANRCRTLRSRMRGLTRSVRGCPDGRQRRTRARSSARGSGIAGRPSNLMCGSLSKGD